MKSPELLKDQVRAFWNAQSCDTQVAVSPKHSRAYFEEIETFRYFDQPFIHSFAQFSRYHGKKVLEVGFGAGTDLVQWIRAGAVVSGIDLTPEALENARNRIRVYGLPSPEQLLVADAENLPFESESFDLGYSFGVLHHTPDTVRGLQELVRVVKPGGELKVMLYNRFSIYVLNQWVKLALLKGKPWKTLTWVAANYLESIDTKAYSRRELGRMLSALGFARVHIHTELTSGDYLSASALPPLNRLYRLAILLAGQKRTWRPEHFAARVNDPQGRKPTVARLDFKGITTSGCSLGFYHCITAQKSSS